MIRAQQYLVVARNKFIEAIEGQILKPYHNIEINEYELGGGEKKVIHVFIPGIDVCPKLELSRENIRFMIDIDGGSNYSLDGLHPYDDRFAAKLEKFLEIILQTIRLKENCQAFTHRDFEKRDIA